MTERAWVANGPVGKSWIGSRALFDVPTARSSFVGRREAIERLSGLLADSTTRLVTLTGPGGVGKTRLAIQAVDACLAFFPGGTRFCALASVVDAGRVLPAIGAELGIKERDSDVLIDQIAESLGGERSLLLLDNLEQLLPAAPVLERLLARQPKLVMLVTSRVPLRIAPEREFPVPPMLLPGEAETAEPAEAATLFIERVREINPRFALTGAGQEAIAEICRRLDGLPLAIELAAARTRVMPPEAVVPWLSHSLRLLTGGPVDQPARQRTMRDAIAWSYGLLSDAEQQAFRRLAIFRGSFRLDAASVALDRDASAMLTALQEQSLLQSQIEDDEPRFRMLQTIREFGLEQLALDPGASLPWQRIAAYWTTRGDEISRRINVLEELNRATLRLQRDHDNLRGSFDWLVEHDPPAAFRLLASLFWFYYSLSHFAEALERHEQLLAGSRDGVPLDTLGSVLLGAGTFAHFQGRSELAVKRLNEALQILRSLEHGWALGFCHLVLGVRAEDIEDYDEAITHLERAIEHLEQSGDRGTADSARYHLAIVAFGQHQFDRAREQLAEVLDRDGELPRIGAWAMQLRALIAVHDGELVSAAATVRQSLRLFQSAGSAAGQNAGFATFAVVATASGRPEIAAEFFGLAERLNRARGDVVTGAERRRYDAAARAARQRLGETGFEVAFRALDEWDIDAAIERALTVDLSRPAALGLRISRRELDVLRLLVTGMTDEEIAGQLFLSTRTVHAHLANIYRKLLVNNRSEAVRVALERGWVSIL